MHAFRSSPLLMIWKYFLSLVRLDIHNCYNPGDFCFHVNVIIPNGSRWLSFYTGRCTLCMKFLIRNIQWVSNCLLQQCSYSSPLWNMFIKALFRPNFVSTQEVRHEKGTHEKGTHIEEEYFTYNLTVSPFRYSEILVDYLEILNYMSRHRGQESTLI